MQDTSVFILINMIDEESEFCLFLLGIELAKEEIG